jgi:O-antigen/teichoic acid export membrane protein
MSMTKSDKMLKSAIVLSIGTFFSKAIVFITAPVFSYWLSVEEYGTFDLIISYASLIIPFISLCCGEALFRFLIDDDSEYNKKIVTTNGLLIITVNFFVFFTLLLIIGNFVSQSVLAILFQFSMYVLVGTIHGFVLQFLRGIKKLSIYSAASLLFSVIISAGAVAFVYALKLGFSGILLAHITAYFISIVFVCFTAKMNRFISVQAVSLGKIKNIIKYSVPMIPNYISWWVINASDRSIIQLFLGLSYNGIFAVAHKIPGICSVLFQILHISSQENISENINESGMDAYLNKLYNAVIQVLISVCCVVLSFNHIFFTYIFKQDYFTAFYHTPILISAVIFSSIANFFGSVFIGLKDTKKVGFTTSMAALINILVHLGMIKFSGLYAASISTLLAGIFLLIIRYKMLSKYVKLRISGKTIIYCIVYCFFLIFAYVNTIRVAVPACLLSSLLFLYSNKIYVLKTLKLMRKR